MTFGILTLATYNDYQKAIGLALSLRISNPGVPTAVACNREVGKLLAPYFDHVVEEDPSIRGFIHKLHLDRYSPYEETFFFDSDVLVFRPVNEVVEHWRSQPYSACGDYITGGVSLFGLDRVRVLKMINHKNLVNIDGAGHAYFRKPDCTPVFDLAREIAANYNEYAGDIKLADEDVMSIVMTIVGLKPMPHFEFWSRYLSGKSGSIRLDAVNARCKLELVTTGQIQFPYMMHFAANEAPLVYAWQLRRLFKNFGINPKGLLWNAFMGSFVRFVKWPIKRNVKRALRGALAVTSRARSQHGTKSSVS
jgi:hypothetical protein